MAVPFMDLKRVHKPLREDMLKVIGDCLDSGQFILGAGVESFERNFAKHMNAQQAVGVASGTDALFLTLQAIGLEPGDEVICPAFGFVASAEVVLRLGATVVFVDVNENYNIDVEAVRAAITEKTKAIIAVHLFGLAADVEVLAQIASDYSVYLVEDVAQACAAERGGNALGTLGIAGCFSFYPTMNLGSIGDGGLVLTDSEELGDLLRLFRNHGRGEDGSHVAIGQSSRLDAVQAAILTLKLGSLKEDNADRIENANFYDSHLDKDVFTLPPCRTEGSHVYNQYTIRHPERDVLQAFLAERQIETRIHYALPLHLLPAFEALGYQEGHFPQAELASQQVISLPIFPGLTRHELEEVVHTMDLFVKTHPVTAAPQS